MCRLISLAVLLLSMFAGTGRADSTWLWVSAAASSNKATPPPDATWQWVCAATEHCTLHPVVMPGATPPAVDPPSLRPCESCPCGCADGKPCTCATCPDARSPADLQKRAYAELFDRAQREKCLVAVYVGLDPPRELPMPACRYDAGFATEKEPTVIYGRFEGDVFRRVGQYYLARPAVSVSGPSYFADRFQPVSVPVRFSSSCPGGNCPLPR